MRKRYVQGEFKPTNPQKYIGKGKIRYLSSWEMRMMIWLDTNPSIEQWASESIIIKYKHPFTGRIASYITDFFIVYTDKNGKKHAEIIEVKPNSQTSLTEAKSKSDKEAAIINMAKWEAARAFCKANNLVFRVVTEKQMFR